MDADPPEFESVPQSPRVRLILDPSSQQCDHALVGGKARNLWLATGETSAVQPGTTMVLHHHRHLH